MPAIMGISHIDLTVTDRDRASAWWQGVLGFELVNRHHDDTFDANSLIHPSGVVVTVLTHHATTSEDTFDERRVGLDHLAFAVEDRDELQQWVAHLDAHGVPHSGIIDAVHGPTLVFRDPDNIQLEFFVYPPRGERGKLSL
ncbi:MAG TPA: VOC family protein [Mycobacterium sp.]|nr:VOC family protein [Mycobacterium sp.]